ncbi:MAG TPA: phosphatase PAP2 family protein [Dongiaceae bacterium]|nr:phosphatase PAP2 family protein [Dongiaceae bacterium]
MPSSIEASPSDTASAATSRWLSGITSSLRENSLLLLIVASILTAANSLSAFLGRPHRALDQAAASYTGYIATCFACFCFAFVVWILHVTLVRKVSIQTKDFWLLVFTEFLSRERLLLALPILAVWPVMILSFSLIKALIPAVVPYYLDPFLHAADRAIHFGQDPWALLHPVLGHPVVTYLIDRIYALWLFVMYFALLLQITSTSDRRRRMHFLLSSMLAWIVLGCVAATLLSSVGPCYFGKVVGAPDTYAPLMAYLRETVQQTPLLDLGAPPELIAVRVQDLLWDYYQQNDIGLGRGISAAPSLHVASTWLMARMFQTYGRRAAIAGWSFFALILVGSVHLGWHYALDGYISIVGAWALWRLVGWLLDRPRLQAILWPKGPAAKAAAEPQLAIDPGDSKRLAES